MQLGLRQIVFMLVLLAMPLAAYYFVFMPRNRQIDEARREIQQKQEKLRQLETATRTVDDLGEQIDKLTETIRVFEEKLPAEREVEVILQQVWELAAKHRLTPRSIRTDKPCATSQYTELPIKLIIVGNFDGFYSFLLDLAQMRRITRTPKMKLVKLNGVEGQMQADMMLSIFYEAQTADRPGGGGESKS